MNQTTICLRSNFNRTRIGKPIFIFLWALLLDASSLSGQALLPKPNPAHQKQVSDYVRRVFQDRNGNLWLGTNDDGVARFDGKILKYFTVEDGLAGRAIRAILQDRAGAIWLATDNGISRFFNGQFQNFTTDDGLNDNDTWCIAEDQSQTIWVGTMKGVCRFESNRFTPLDLPPSDVKNPTLHLSPNLVWSMLVDRSGELWIGTEGSGVYRFNGHEVRSLSVTDGLPSNQISSIVQDQSGKLWFGFVSGGVCLYDGTSIRSFGRASGLPDGWVWTMLLDQHGDLLVSVLGSGIHRFKEGQFQSTELNRLGLPSHVQSMMEDDNGDLWLGCSGGLYCRQSGKLLNVTKNGNGVLLVDKTTESARQLAHFGNMVSGAWVVTAATGKKMVHSWKWGPGQKSIERWTEGESAGGAPWRELMVYYWDPQEQQVRFLGVSPFAEGIARGSIAFNGIDALASVRLSQSQAIRDMQTQWHFRDSDHYVETLLEKNRTGQYSELVSFEHVRASMPDVYEPEATSIPQTHQEFSFLLSDSWVAQLPAELGMTAHASITWIPTAQFYYGQVFHNSKSKAGDAWANIYIFRDVESKTFRCLVLTAEPTVYQGELEITQQGSIRVKLHSSPPHASTTSTATIENLDSGLLFRKTHDSGAESKSLELQWTRN